MSQNTFLHAQNPDNAPLRDDASPSEIRAHYSHVETLLRKNAHFKNRPIDDPVFDAAASAHHQTRLHLQIQHYGSEVMGADSLINAEQKRATWIANMVKNEYRTIAQSKKRNIER